MIRAQRLVLALAIAWASAAAAQEESAGAPEAPGQLFAEAPQLAQQSPAIAGDDFVPAPPLLQAGGATLHAELALPPMRPVPEVRPAVPAPAGPPALPPPEKVTVTAPTTLASAAAPAGPSNEVKLAAPEATGAPLRQGRFFAQTDGALTASTSPTKDAAAIALTARGGYLFNPQFAAGVKLTWAASGQGSLVGGGVFGAYHLSIGNPRIVPEVGGGLTVYSASSGDITTAGVLVDGTGALDVFVTDAVAIQPYVTVAVGSLWGEPRVEGRLGWALAVYF